MLSARARTALVDLIAAIRPDWHTPGISAALRGSNHDPATTAAAMLRRAANPANRTPALQPADYDQPTARCPVQSGWPHHRCAGCLVDAGLLIDPNAPVIPPFVVYGHGDAHA